MVLIEMKDKVGDWKYRWAFGDEMRCWFLALESASGGLVRGRHDQRGNEEGAVPVPHLPRASFVSSLILQFSSHFLKLPHSLSHNLLIPTTHPPTNSHTRKRDPLSRESKIENRESDIVALPSHNDAILSIHPTCQRVISIKTLC